MIVQVHHVIASGLELHVRHDDMHRIRYAVLVTHFHLYK